MIRRLIACVLSIASPSRVFWPPDYGPNPSWLDRWEMRIDAEQRARMMVAAADLRAQFPDVNPLDPMGLFEPLREGGPDGDAAPGPAEAPASALGDDVGPRGQR